MPTCSHSSSKAEQKQQPNSVPAGTFAFNPLMCGQVFPWKHFSLGSTETTPVERSVADHRVKSSLTRAH
jgi:hypothetical protein